MHTKNLNKTSTIEKFSCNPLEGTALCDFALFTLPKDFLTSLLPEELELAPQPFDVPAGQHPVFIMGNDTDLHFNLFLEKVAQEQNIIPDLKYDEFLCSIPYVQFKNKPLLGSKGPYIFMPVLYLNNHIAVWGGRVFYEFNKEFMSIQKTDDTLIIENEGTLVLQENFGKTGAPAPAQSFPNFNTLSAIFELPTIEFGPYGYVKSKYTMDYKNSEVQPGQIEINNSTSPYLPLGSFTVPDITTSVFGAFRFPYQWSLSYISFVEF